MMINIKNVEAQAAEQIKKNKTKAKKVIESPDKFDLLISETYKVAKNIPCIGNMLSKILVMVSMTKDYIDGDQTACFNCFNNRCIAYLFSIGCRFNS